MVEYRGDVVEYRCDEAESRGKEAEERGDADWPCAVPCDRRHDSPDVRHAWSAVPPREPGVAVRPPEGVPVAAPDRLHPSEPVIAPREACDAAWNWAATRPFE